MPEKSCGAVIFHNGNGRKYLLLRYGWGHWGFVKGHAEEGEDCTRTAKREAEEEAGLAEGWLDFIPNFREKINYFYTMEGKRRYKDVVYFLAECRADVADRIKLSYEHTDYEWLSYDEAVKRLTYENDRNIMEKAEKFLNKTNLK